MSAALFWQNKWAYFAWNRPHHPSTPPNCASFHGSSKYYRYTYMSLELSQTPQSIPQKRSNLSHSYSLDKRKCQGKFVGWLQMLSTGHYWRCLRPKIAIFCTSLENSVIAIITLELTVGQPVSAMKNLGALLN